MKNPASPEIKKYEFKKGLPIEFDIFRFENVQEDYFFNNS